MRVTGLSGDLAWWRETRDSPDADPAALRELLERLQAWKTQHDADRAQQPGPFLKMVWDGIFADDDNDAGEAIAEIEKALAAR
ncbi:MAG: hypothetical protein KKE02_21155 [Alphaproteobacteria bacterium]|nr:hypothetical protein [Alphaproteobacteria bacterium]MBU1514455.1 hypothetical protein [Alphaproteobacteria bacterium]MBU2096913.1 hypothetical protein [Alphaproteobacteria bacterium]MBU2153540.1 hypothetical protein [Alphaproteobacteria bacterium]MBU2305955.1 hypothetical protein [Alphaproteobacteria bacterium]